MRRNAAVLAGGAIVALAAVVIARSGPSARVTSSVSGKTYSVLKRHDKRGAADSLAKLDLSCRGFLDAALAMYPTDARLLNIERRWNGTLSEATSQDVGYSVDKGSVHLCVRNSATGALEPHNTAMFVLLHELAHLATDTYGHPPEYWDNFRFLLEIAELTGYYSYEDFGESQVEYCGKTMGPSPLSCVKTGACGSQLA